MSATVAYRNGKEIELASMTDEARARLFRHAKVEVRCGLDHMSIWRKGYGWGCRYARGYVGHKESGLRIRAHQCHLCGGCYWAMRADTPPDEQCCDNCGGPLIVSAVPSFPLDLVGLNDFIESR